MEMDILKRLLKNLNHHIHLICSTLLLCVCFHVASRDFVVTLDAGHGGKDYGAIGKITNEKTITLSVVKQLGALIEKNLNDVKVVYTRKTDEFITLSRRAEISNQAGTDLFISVHINSVDKRNKRRTTIEGCQVYTLGLHKSAENLEVAKRENSVIELEEDNSAHYADFDPNSLESDIIFELSQNKRLDQSIEFADAIHTQLSTTANRAPKGVRQAGFWVLWATSAPAVLVELDFICNPNSEKFLHSAKGQEKMVAALYNAFCAYLNTYGSGITGHTLPWAKPITVSGAKTAEGNLHSYPATQNLDIDNSSHSLHQTAKNNSDIANNKVTELRKSKETRYFVQLIASSTALTPSAKEFKGFEGLEYYKDGGMYKYVLGPADSLDDAKKMLEQVREYFPECFIVTIKNGKRTGFIKP